MIFVDLPHSAGITQSQVHNLILAARQYLSSKNNIPLTIETFESQEVIESEGIKFGSCLLRSK